MFKRAAKLQAIYPPPATDSEVNNCFSIYLSSEIIELKNDDLNSFTVAKDLITILASNDRTAVAFSFRQIKL